jgi:CRISPR/Cas system-associated endoribonuclease Cas2
MAFEKGISGNPEGRPKGAVNRTSQQLREMISGFLEENFEKIKTDFNFLTPKERAKIYCDLLQYGLPRLQAVQFETEFERLPEDQLDKIIEELKKVG